MNIKNPIAVTGISFIASSIFIFVLAILIDLQHAAGEQYFLTIIVKGIQYQSIFCFVVYVLSGLIFRNWVMRHRVIYTLFLILLSSWLIFILFFNHN